MFPECFPATSARQLRDAWGERPARIAFAHEHPLIGGVVAELEETLRAGGLVAEFVRLLPEEAAPANAAWTAETAIAGRRFEAVDPVRLAAATKANRITAAFVGLDRITASGRALKAEFEADRGQTADLNLYISPPDSRGFAAHYDPQDVLLLQLRGSKRWTVHEPAFRLPTPRHHREGMHVGTVGDPLEWALSEGEALYMPRGWIHEGVAGPDGSAHLTVGLTIATLATDLAAAAIARSDFDETFRQPAHTLTEDELDVALEAVRRAVVEPSMAPEPPGRDLIERFLR